MDGEGCGRRVVHPRVALEVEVIEVRYGAVAVLHAPERVQEIVRDVADVGILGGDDGRPGERAAARKLNRFQARPAPSAPQHPGEHPRIGRIGDHAVALTGPGADADDDPHAAVGVRIRVPAGGGQGIGQQTAHPAPVHLIVEGADPELAKGSGHLVPAGQPRLDPRLAVGGHPDVAVHLAHLLFDLGQGERGLRAGEANGDNQNLLRPFDQHRIGHAGRRRGRPRQEGHQHDQRQ